MNILNIEIKCRIDNPDYLCSLLKNKNARFIGKDNQTDTYFKVNSGRLKLRQGNIENSLIHYFRPESKSLKRSVVRLQELSRDNQNLYRMLKLMHGILTTVRKSRKIFFIENVKFHIDLVENLGGFVEIEAMDKEGKYSESYLRSQCEYYIEYLELNREDFVDSSYSDLIINSNENTAEPKELAV